MDTKEVIERGQYVFDKVLSFIPRVDAKISTLLAINTGMLALLGSNMPALDLFKEWYMFVPILPLISVSATLYFLYQSSYPSLHGGQSSLIYFREICKRTESNFMKEFQAQTEEDFAKDIMGQTWRNAEIASKKYQTIKNAFVCTALTIVPWAISLSIFVSKNHLATQAIVK